MKPSIIISIFIGIISIHCSKKNDILTPEPNWVITKKDCSQSNSPCDGLTILKDIDGNLYHLVEIGNQCWTKENLSVSRYADGSPIITGMIDSIWYKTKLGSYAIYDNLPANDVTYGKLYNWYAVSDPRGLAPPGWHVATHSDWEILYSYLGADKLVGGKLKTTGTSDWLSPNIYATNSSEFSALPGGRRWEAGAYIEMHERAYWWTSSIYPSNGNPYYMLVVNSNAELKFYDVYRENGLSVRLIKD